MFADHERLIFSYEVAGRRVLADPLELRRKLLRASAGRFYTWWADSAEPEQHERAEPPPGEGQAAPDIGRALAEAHAASRFLAALDAQERCLAVVREVFSLPAVDASTGEGVPEGVCWKILGDYQEWLEGEEIAGGTTPSTSPAGSPHETAGSSTTPPTSGCS